MGKPTGFIELKRKKPPKREVTERLADYREVEVEFEAEDLRAQATRCMDCGIPFCHKGCPLGNHIPDWNDSVHAGDMEAAIKRLHDTNNFPEFTGLTCPAPCEESCVLSINDEPVTIKQIERQIATTAWDAGWIQPQIVGKKTGRTVAVVGSGPAGLAAAQQLARTGHTVTVFERSDRPGGLLRYGIPDFKLGKYHVERRIEQMEAEGVLFKTGVNIGVDVTLDELRQGFDAVCLSVGALKARELDIPGRDLEGVHLAMDYLTAQNRIVAGDTVPGAISATGKRVVILGGGDTGADCLGTAHRQGAAHVFHYHYKAAPPSERTEEMPWPWWPMVLRESSSHEEGGERGWAVTAKAFEGTAGKLERMRCVRVEWETSPDGRPRMVEIPGTETVVETDLVLLAIGFVGPEAEHLKNGSPIALTGRHTIAADDQFRTSFPGVFACGDARRGASLVVWAIWEGREAARAIDLYLMGSSSLPTSPNPNPIS